MGQLLIDLAAWLYNAVIWVVIPFGTGALVYRWFEGGRAGRLRERAVEREIDPSVAWHEGNRIERRAFAYAAGASIVAAVIVAFADANMHAIIRAAHRSHDD